MAIGKIAGIKRTTKEGERMSEKKFPKLYCPMCDKELNENHKMLVQKAMLLMMSPIGNNFEFQGKELWCEKCFDDLSNEKCVIKND